MIIPESIGALFSIISALVIGILMFFGMFIG